MDLPPHLTAEQVKEILLPPALEKLHELPYEQILWENFERLCLELAKEDSEVVSARPYGVKGNEQGGIDIFARNTAKKYIVYQCKNEKDFIPSKIKTAVQKYLDGDWTDESEQFVLCTRESLQKKDRADEIIKQEKILEDKGIKFVIWDSVELNSMLKKYPQLVYNFFGIHWFIGFCGWEQLNVIKLDYPIPPKKKYTVPNGYLGRTVSKNSDDNFAAYFQPEKSLFDVFKEYRKVTLLAWGLNGKSIEIENLAAILSETKEYHPHLIRFSNYSNEPIESLVKDIAYIPQESLVILFDGLDEALQDEFDKVCRRIDKFAGDYPLARIVASCRTNYYTTFAGDNSSDTLKSFDAFTLNYWGYEEIMRNVRNIHQENANVFLETVNQKQLFELLRLPYYLLKLSAQFKATGTIVNSKAEIFEDETRQLIRKEIKRTYTTEHDLQENKLYRLLAKLAFVMEASNTNFISNVDLLTIIPDNGERKMVTNAASIFYGTESSAKTWRFHHHNTQEYLAAVILSAKPFSFVRKIIGIAPSFEKAKPSWFDSILFLYSILPANHQLKTDILRWVTDKNKELAIKLEPEKLDDETRFKVFKAIFSQYKREQRRINNQLYKNADLSNFSACPATFEYLLNELENSTEINNETNALEIMADFDIQKFPAFYQKFKDTFCEILLHDTKELHYSALHGYTEHYNLTFGELKPIYDKFISTNSDIIRPQLFKTIHRLGLAEKFTTEIVTHLILIIGEERKRFQQQNYSSRLGTEYGEVARCLESLTTAEALTELLNRLGNDFLTFAQLTYFEDTLPVILKNISANTGNADLQRKTIDLFKANHSYILNNLRACAAFLDFFKSNELMDMVAAELCVNIEAYDASTINSVSILASKNTMDLLFEKRKAGSLEDRLADSLNYFLEKNDNSELIYFREIFKIPEPVKKPVMEYAKVE